MPLYYFIISKIKKKNQSKIARALSNSFKISKSTTSFNSSPFFFFLAFSIYFNASQEQPPARQKFLTKHCLDSKQYF